MQVGDGFAAMGAIVDDEAIAALGDALAACDLCGGNEQVTQKRFIFSRREGDAWNDGLRHDQDMHWRFGRNIPECEAEIVLVNDLSGDFPVTDFFEKRLLGHATGECHDRCRLQARR